jgi:hypothetical protein
MADDREEPDRVRAASTTGADDPACCTKVSKYEAPRLLVLGTVAELTSGGSVGGNDGYGAAGAVGSIGG